MKTLRITFDDDYPDDWIETIIAPVPLGTLLDIIAKSSRVALTREAFGELYGLFAPFVVEWSWPEPVGVEGLFARDMNQMLPAIYEWAAGVREAPRPLPRRSSDTTPSEDPPD